MERGAMRRLLVLLGALAAGAAPAATQEASGLRVRAGAQEITFDGRVQTQFNTTSADGVPDYELFIRRVYLGATVRVNEVVGGRVQMDFAGNRVVLRDAFLTLTFSPALQLLAGNAYRPFSILTQTSDVRILPVERGARIRGVSAWEAQNLVNDLGYGERDIGIQLRGEPRGAPLGFSYAAGFFRGPLLVTDRSENLYQLAARLGIRPTARLRLGAGWSDRDFRGADESLRRGSAWGVDLDYNRFASGPSLAAEAVWGDFDPHGGHTFRGAQGWFGFRTAEAERTVSLIEPGLRVSYGSVEGPLRDRGGVLVTPVLNLYFGGWNRIMLNYDLWSPREGGTEGSFKAQFQLSF